MTSKVINMVERMKDKDDLALENLFGAQPAIADDGFSRKVMARLRRRIWVQRLAMPVAILLGALIAFQPALEVLRALYGLLDVLPSGVVTVPADSIPQMSTMVIVAGVIVAALFLAPALEE